MQARGAIANFMGHIKVQPEESNYRLTPGLWLVRPMHDCCLNVTATPMTHACLDQCFACIRLVW